jgi:hypothetical protein
MKVSYIKYDNSVSSSQKKNKGNNHCVGIVGNMSPPPHKAQQPLVGQGLLVIEVLQ